MMFRIAIASLCFAAAVFAAPAPKVTDPAKALIQDLEGDWSVVSFSELGMANRDVAHHIYRFKGKSLSVNDGTKTLQQFNLVFEVAKSPVTVDFAMEQPSERSFLGIIECKGETLRLCWIPDGKARPTEFTSSKQQQTVLLVLKRKKT